MTACDSLKAHSNHAAALIVQGKQHEAFEELQLAIKDAFSSCSWHDDAFPVETTGHPSFEVMVLTGPTNTSDDTSDTLFRWPIISLAPNTRHDENAALQDLCSMTTACVVALFNMGLCCHLSLQERDLPAREHDALLAQAERLYLKGIELGVHCNVAVLNLALSANLMDISFACGDLSRLHIWHAYFTHEMKLLPPNIPANIFSAFCRAHFLFSGTIVAARAA